MKARAVDSLERLPCGACRSSVAAVISAEGVNVICGTKGDAGHKEEGQNDAAESKRFGHSQHPRLPSLRLAKSSTRGVLSSPGNPAAISRSLRNLGQWLCVPLFREVCLFQVISLSSGSQEKLSAWGSTGHAKAAKRPKGCKSEPSLLIIAGKETHILRITHGNHAEHTGTVCLQRPRSRPARYRAVRGDRACGWLGKRGRALEGAHAPIAGPEPNPNGGMRRRLWTT